MQIRLPTVYIQKRYRSLSDVPTIGGVGTVLRVGSGSLLEWATLSGGGSSQWTTSGLNIYYTDGNVGIGTQTPSTKLEVNEDDVKITCTSGKGLHLYGSSASANWKLLPSTGVTTKMFRIYDNDNTADRLVINGSGNVGIGNNNPGHKLDVTGDINFTGSLLQNGSAFGSSPWTNNSGTVEFDGGIDITGSIKQNGDPYPLVSRGYARINCSGNIRSSNNTQDQAVTMLLVPIQRVIFPHI